MKTADGCITNDNYPQAYDNQEFCEISVQQPLLGSVSAVSFDTEGGWDFLTINGDGYSGANGPQGVTPTTTITWSSDYMVTKSGWKLCPDNPASPLCGSADRFVVDVGRMTMRGVAPLYQDRTCVSGQTCTLDGIIGFHLASSDRVMVLDTCKAVLDNATSRIYFSELIGFPRTSRQISILFLRIFVAI